MIDRGGDSTSSPALANRPGTWCENDRLANNASRGLSNHQHHCAGLFRSPFGQTAHSSTHLNYHFMHSTTFWGCVPGRGEKTWKVVNLTEVLSAHHLTSPGNFSGSGEVKKYFYNPYKSDSLH